MNFLSSLLIQNKIRLDVTKKSLIRLPGKSFGLKFIPSQSDSFRFIPKSVSAPIRTHSNQSEKSFQSRSM